MFEPKAIKIKLAELQELVKEEAQDFNKLREEFLEVTIISINLGISYKVLIGK